jgi:short-subunit dehydrogenase
VHAKPEPTAVIIGASSGIGEELAREMHREGWRLGLLARRLDALDALATEFGAGTVVGRVDVGEAGAATILEGMIGNLGGVDVIVVSAGVGHLNPDLSAALDLDTVRVNVTGFMTIAQVAMRHFLARGRGHLVGISSIAALRGHGSTASYAASKAFQSIYLDSMRDLARASGLPIAVTEAQPGFVQTAMMKTDRPLPSFVARLFVASPAVAARQILSAVHKRKRHAYITRRYGFVALVLRLLPRAG